MVVLLPELAKMEPKICCKKQKSGTKMWNIIEYKHLYNM